MNEAIDGSRSAADARQFEAGFSYIDVMIGMMILMVGCLALASALVAAVVQASGGESQLAAKQFAASGLESVLSARDIGQLGWNNIGNTNGVVDAGDAQIPIGIFRDGRRAIYESAGADNLIGTADDSGTIVPRFERQISIVNADASGRARRVEVTIFYNVSGIARRETIATIITDYISN